MIEIDEYEGSLDGLTDALRIAASGVDFGEARIEDAQEVEWIGPVPFRTVTSRSFLESGWDAARHSGWRGLVLQAEVPIASVDIFQREGAPQFAVQGRRAAVLLAARFDDALAFHDSDAAYTLSWLSLPDVHIEGVLLTGEDIVFLPGRLGGREIDEGRRMTLDELSAAVAGIRAAVEPPAGLAERAFDDRLPVSGPAP